MNSRADFRSGRVRPVRLRRGVCFAQPLLRGPHHPEGGRGSWRRL